VIFLNKKLEKSDHLIPKKIFVKHQEVFFHAFKKIRNYIDFVIDLFLDEVLDPNMR